MNIFELPERDFLAMLPELAQQGVNTDDLRRRYREANSLAGPAAQRAQADVAARGRRPVAGGLLSKPEGATGMDAVRGLEFEPATGLLGALAGAERAITAPGQANLIPQQDMALEALGTAGMAMTGGGAVGAPRGAIRSGLARNVDDLTPAKQMARRILELRAAGRASEVTDDMMAAADPQYMFANTPLPMDEASRLARARDMGFDVDAPLYHGTPSADIQAFRPSASGAAGPGVYTSKLPSTASGYAEGMGLFDRRRAFSDDTGTWIEGGNVLDVVGPRNLQPSEDWIANMMDQMSTNSIPRSKAAAGATQQAIAEGFEGAQARSPVSSMDGNVVVFDPTNIRSRFARFDPEFSHLSNLSAANASAPAGLLAMPAQEPQEQKLPFMSLLKGLLQ